MPEGFEEVRGLLRSQGVDVHVHSIDKFPRMTDYVVPTGVRVADADRVRLFAYLGEGATVMHEGFVNLHAGALGKSMIEGRVSAGVTVDDGSDVGGGASLMGTLSGGGNMVIRVGRGSLLGANSGCGIPLGDGCTVETGLYVTAGTTCSLSDGRAVKARELAGRDDLDVAARGLGSGDPQAEPGAGLDAGSPAGGRRSGLRRGHEQRGPFPDGAGHGELNTPGRRLSPDRVLQRWDRSLDPGRRRRGPY